MVVVASGIEIWTMVLGVPGHRVVSKTVAVGSPMLVSQSGGDASGHVATMLRNNLMKSGVPLPAEEMVQSR